MSTKCVQSTSLLCDKYVRKLTEKCQSNLSRVRINVSMKRNVWCKMATPDSSVISPVVTLFQCKLTTKCASKNVTILVSIWQKYKIFMANVLFVFLITLRCFVGVWSWWSGQQQWTMTDCMIVFSKNLLFLKQLGSSDDEMIMCLIQDCMIGLGIWCMTCCKWVRPIQHLLI